MSNGHPLDPYRHRKSNVYLHTPTHTHTHTHTRLHLHLHLHTYTHTYTHTQIPREPQCYCGAQLRHVALIKNLPQHKAVGGCVRYVRVCARVHSCGARVPARTPACVRASMPVSARSGFLAFRQRRECESIRVYVHTSTSALLFRDLDAAARNIISDAGRASLLLPINTCTYPPTHTHTHLPPLPTYASAHACSRSCTHFPTQQFLWVPV